MDWVLVIKNVSPVAGVYAHCEDHSGSVIGEISWLHVQLIVSRAQIRLHVLEVLNFFREL